MENAGQAAGERDDGDVLTPARGDARGPRPERPGRGGRRRRIERAARMSSQRTREWGPPR
jgi:hypothetical protein